MLKRIVTLMFLALSLATMAMGQTSTGTLTGTVEDPSGATIAGAAISARNLETGLVSKGKSTGAGLYVLPNLPPGTYSVTVTKTGFKRFEQIGVTIDIASTTALKIKMSLGALTEKVTVNGGAPLLQTTSSEIGTVVPNALINSLPLEVSGTIRNPIQFIELAPGFEGSLGNNPDNNADDDFKLSGGQVTGADVLVDGLTTSLVSPNTQQNYGVSPEAISEFKTLQNNFPAQYGFTGDAIIDLTLKSGTNQLHGSAYDYLQNAALDAAGWVNDTAGTLEPANTQNDFGASIGGPVVLPKIYNGKNRTFFFFDYEGFRYHVGSTGVASLVPAAFRQGDFSSLLPGIQLYDPTTHQPIAGNLLSSDPNFHPSTVITKLFNLLPAPSNSSLSNNALVTSTTFTTANLFDLKVDHSISSKQRVVGSFDFDNTNTGSTSSLGVPWGSGTPQNTRYARFAHYYVFSPSVFNQFMVGFSRRWRGELGDSIGGNYPPTLGVTGVANTTFPCFDFEDSPYSFWPTCGDSQFADNTYQLADSVTWIHAGHDFTFGGELMDLQFNVRRLTYSSGSFTFAPTETGSPGVPNSGYSVASALFGLVDSSELVYGGFSGVRYKNNDLYAQDSFKVTPRLTLNYGLRYDLDVPATEAFNRFSAVDPTLPNPGAGNILGAYTYYGTGPGRNGETRPQNIYTKDFGPRLGFAYGIKSNTVIRGGFGIYYEPLKEGAYADQDGLGFFNTEDLSYGNGTPFQIDSGMPHTVPPSGPLTPQGQNGESGVILVPPNVMPGQMLNWNLDVERQVTNNLMLSAAYVGSRGLYLPTLNIIPNQVNPTYLSLGSELTMSASCLTNGGCPLAAAEGIHLPYNGFSGSLVQALRPFPQYGDFNDDDNSFTPDRTGSSIYHAMQLSITKRTSHGLTFLVSYTVSKDITDAESMGTDVGGYSNADSYGGENSYDRKAERSVSEFDTPQALTPSFVYQLPFGNGQRFLSHAGPASRLISGWYVSGILGFSSGTPLAVYTSCGGTAEQILFAGCEITGQAMVNLVPGVPETNKGANFNPETTPFFNLKAFALPAPYTLGDEGRTLPHARSPSGQSEDLTLGKKIYLYHERVALDFRAEFFDAFNWTFMGGPTLPLDGGSSFGQSFLPARSPGCSGPFACGFGAVTSAGGARTIQFGLKFTF